MYNYLSTGQSHICIVEFQTKKSCQKVQQSSSRLSNEKDKICLIMVKDLSINDIVDI